MTDRPTRIALAAPAKINLFLHIQGRRGDGFHDLDTLFQAVDLQDHLEIETTPGGVDLAVRGADLGAVESNLVHRAAVAYLEETGADLGVRIRLQKNIPAGGGLGGGSSDAAATLRGLNHLTGGAVDPARLLEMGANLGSDVPFFLGSSPLARAAGRGERLQPLEPLAPAHVVLVLPPVHVATGPAFGALAESRRGGYQEGGRAPGPEYVPSGWDDVADAAHNDFEAVVPVRFPEVAAALDALRRRGGLASLMSGSGAACFAVFAGAAPAAAAAEALRGELGWPVVATETLTRWPEVRGG